MKDPALRQCLLEFGHSRIGDLRPFEFDPLQTGQPRQMHPDLRLSPYFFFHLSPQPMKVG